MKIVGRTVGTTIPKPNWNQNDPSKGDYIFNKPIDTVIFTADVEDGLSCGLTSSMEADKIRDLILAGKSVAYQIVQSNGQTTSGMIAYRARENGYYSLYAGLVNYHSETAAWEMEISPQYVNPENGLFHLDEELYKLSNQVVKAVNGTSPDEDGNVSVTSTCELTQPVWGASNADGESLLLSVSYDGRNGYSYPMTRDEYDSLLARCSMAQLVDDLGEPVQSVDLGELQFINYDHDLDDVAEPCLMYYSDMDYYTLEIYGTKEAYTKIPAEYLDLSQLGDIETALDSILAMQEELMIV